MRIAFLSRATPAHRAAGGMERHTDLLGRGLAARGHEVHVLTTRLADAATPDTPGERLRFEYLSASRPGNYRGGYWHAAADAFRRAHTEAPFDVVLSQSAGAFGLLMRSHEERPPVVLLLHGTSFGEIRSALHSGLGPRTWGRVAVQLINHFALTRRLAPRAEAFVCVSEALRLQVLRELHLDPARVLCIPNGIDIDLFRPAGASAPPSRRRLVYAGRLSDEKGLALLLETVRDMRRAGQQVSLDCYGDGPRRNAYERFARALVPEAVRFHGSVAPDVLATRLAAADLFVFPTLRDEGMPLNVLEAMACGLPVVGSARPGVREILTDGVEGVLVPPGDRTALGAAVAALLDDDERRHRCGRAARARAEAQFSHRRMVDAYDGVLRDIVEEST